MCTLTNCEDLDEMQHNATFHQGSVLPRLCFPGGTDKSPLGQKPTRTKAHWTISHWTKAHCLIWQGRQKPTSLEKIGLKLHCL